MTVFIQPSVVSALIEQSANVEKGLSQRFLWVVPRPSIVTFDRLQQVDTNFVSTIIAIIDNNLLYYRRHLM